MSAVEPWAGKMHFAMSPDRVILFNTKGQIVTSAARHCPVEKNWYAQWPEKMGCYRGNNMLLTSYPCYDYPTGSIL